MLDAFLAWVRRYVLQRGNEVTVGDRIARISAADLDPQASVRLVESELRDDPNWAAHLDKQQHVVRRNFVAAALKEAGQGAVALKVVDSYDNDGNYSYYVLVGLDGIETWYYVTMFHLVKDLAPDMA